ncbi:hypothetical protein [Polaribacter septentrionalilitoris]|uniref:hypothetical protein n=1 Tax=Polaribacter septentrionalilitoris TaxID=2494657 RepID=UPI0013577359|nr:hypothetical protein [Polaribacter septentrionalilitoris]
MKILISILIIGMAIYITNKENGNPIKKINTLRKEKTSAKEFVKTIESLGYFKYANERDIERLKKNHLESFDSEGSWGGIWDDETNLPIDYRYYFCDGETVFEQGGFKEMLNELSGTFEKIGFKLKIGNHFEEWDSKNEWLNHRITLNETEYIIFKNFKGYGWGEAVQRLAEILNEELEKQNIKERIYLISGGNDGSLIFLDNELYKYFYKTFTDPEWKPLEVKEWVKVMGIKKMKLE